MTLRLYYHPFSSYCQKVLVALYERAVPFEGEIVDLGDARQRAALERLWPLAKFPVLRDDARGVTVPESSTIIAYLDRVVPGPPAMIPSDPDAALRTNIWDRFFDNYVETPLQKVVGDTFRPEGANDPHGVGEAKALLSKAYSILEARLGEGGGEWIAGRDFTLADCGAGPALFYANIVVPFAGNPQLEAYYARLLARPSFARAVDQARPYRKLFPLEWPEGY
jgi:glutathione S-transferase